MARDYYYTVTYPDGRVSGPTRLALEETLTEAKRAITQQRKHYPDCSFELEEYDDITGEFIQKFDCPSLNFQKANT